MEKAKRKISSELTQKRLTLQLSLILALSILLLFFPIVWLDSPISVSLQTYALVPLLSIPLVSPYFRRGALEKQNFILTILCLALVLLLYLKLDSWGCMGGRGHPTYFNMATSGISFQMGCARVVLLVPF
jgi:hypothetical protein